MDEETRKTFNLAGILWVFFALSITISVLFFKILPLAFPDILANFINLIPGFFSFLLAISLPGVMAILLTNPKSQNWINKRKFLFWAISILAFVAVNYLTIGLWELPPPFYLLLHPLFGLYVSLWFIPIKFPNIKSLFVSITIGVMSSVAFIGVSMFIFAWYVRLFDKGELAGLGYVFIGPPGLIIIMGTSIIIGIGLSIRKKTPPDFPGIQD